ncbi:isochorismate synthase [Aeromicrobium sp. Marseille-Q0843]|uniref:isochorismate synthase n=1 Tax=Aeromicrobium phoceense TaxID=2754045 RepID=A0A838XEH9_9ACTN|nr:isochorismate synthase [Aeromicrobium phoceense]
MNPTLEPTRSASALRHSPLVFAGSDPFAADEVRRTLQARTGDPDLACRVIRALEPGERAVVSAAFRADGPVVAHLVTPRALGRAEPSPVEVRVHDVVPEPDRSAYVDLVATALDRIEGADVAKVVRGRCLEGHSSPALSPAEVTATLLDRRPGRYVFSLPLDDRPEAPWLVGASPELLVRRRGVEIASTPLAGSVPRSPDPDEDSRRAAALADSAKDLAEHAFVVDHIAAALGPACEWLEVPAAPEVLATDSMWHLASPIRGRLRAPEDLTAPDLAQLLPPPPAVGGVPTPEATDLIDELEGPGLRGPFGGFVGWMDGDGDGELAVTIRAGVLDGERLRLFAGAGIVAGSDPLAEADETAAKLSTMTRAGGL